MKKVLMILGIVFLVVIVGVVGLLVWAQRSGNARQEVFFKAVGSGDPQQVTALFDPLLREEVDEPVLAAWMQQVKSKLGKFTGLSKTNFSTETRYEDDAKISESKGTVLFEKGEATSELKFRNDLLIAFHVNSKQIPPDWFHGPASTEFYKRRAREFVRAALNREYQTAFDMEHPALQKAMPMEKFKAAMDKIIQLAGPVKSITFVADSADGEPPDITLKIEFKVQGEKKSFPAQVEFRAMGLKMPLAAFDIASKFE